MGENVPVYGNGGPPDSPTKSPTRSNGFNVSNSGDNEGNNNGSASNVDDSGDEDLVDYSDERLMSPIKRMNATIPETIPE